MFRRDFLKKFGFLSAAAAVPATLAKASEFDSTAAKLSTTNIKGRVFAGEKGIQEVSVTDGINVVQTKQDGSYELISNLATEFIYISLPAGFEFPHLNGITQFFKVVDRSENTFTANFELRKLSRSDNNHTFVVWADPQIATKKDAERLLTQTAPDLKALVESYGKGELIHGIGCGDLVFDEFDLYPDYKKALEISGIPFFNLIGNHDMDYDARSDEGSANTFKKNFGPTYYSFNRGKIHYVVLDDVFYIGISGQYIGYINEVQLQWLEQDLKTVTPGSTIVVSMHIPTNTGQFRREKKDDIDLRNTVVNRKQLYEILKPYTVHIMSGHTHFHEVWIEGNLIEHNHGTVCGAWWTGDICGDGTPNGYGVYEVVGDNIRWFYKSTGKPKTHQMRIYSKGRHKEYPDEICINVWNYDKNWKIEWQADGKIMGAPEQRAAFDPLARETLSGSGLPRGNGWVEPDLTDHLFFVKPDAAMKQIKIVVTDSFGNTYSESVSL